MIINRTCVMCKREIELLVPEYAYIEWKNGMYIQDAMSMLTPDERELLISGTCGECFDKLYPEE